MSFRLKQFVWRWGPALAVMLVIFAASSRAAYQLPDFGSWDLLVKKSGHLLGYGLLGLAYLHGLGPGRRPSARQAALAVLLAALYGMTDEYHQSFVAGRSSTVVDVGIDTLGAALSTGLRLLTRTPAPPGPLHSTR